MYYNLIIGFLTLFSFYQAKAQENRELTVLFPFDKSELSTSTQQDINSILNGQGTHERIDVLGHTDIYGTENYNMELSRKRALSVKSYLVSQGIDSSKVYIGYFGEGGPLRVDDKFNRRVEMIIRMKASEEPCVGTKKYVMQRTFPIDLNDDGTTDYVIRYKSRGNESLSSLFGEFCKRENNKFLYSSDKRHVQLQKGDTLFAQPPAPYKWTDGNLHVVDYKEEKNNTWETRNLTDPTLMYVGVQMQNGGTEEIGWVKLKFSSCTGLFEVLGKSLTKEKYIIIDQ